MMPCLAHADLRDHSLKVPIETSSFAMSAAHTADGLGQSSNNRQEESPQESSSSAAHLDTKEVDDGEEPWKAHFGALKPEAKAFVVSNKERSYEPTLAG